MESPRSESPALAGGNCDVPTAVWAVTMGSSAAHSHGRHQTARAAWRARPTGRQMRWCLTGCGHRWRTLSAVSVRWIPVACCTGLLSSKANPRAASEGRCKLSGGHAVVRRACSWTVVGRRFNNQAAGRRVMQSVWPRPFSFLCAWLQDIGGRFAASSIPQPPLSLSPSSAAGPRAAALAIVPAFCAQCRAITRPQTGGPAR